MVHYTGQGVGLSGPQRPALGSTSARPMIEPSCGQARGGPMQRRFLMLLMLWSLGLSVAMSACGPLPRAPSGSDLCVVQAQTAPRGTIPATFATALAFAPDGRLFWAERSGTIKVWQDGAAHTFSQVPTVTTERDGSYSERGVLGLAISP